MSQCGAINSTEMLNFVYRLLAKTETLSDQARELNANVVFTGSFAWSDGQSRNP